MCWKVIRTFQQSFKSPPKKLPPNAQCIKTKIARSYFRIPKTLSWRSNSLTALEKICNSGTLRILVFYFLLHCMGYDRCDIFPFDFEPNGIPFGSKSKGKLSPRQYPIQCQRNWKHSFLSDRKTATDRLISYIAVRETGVSRHQGGPIEGPPETPRTS